MARHIIGFTYKPKIPAVRAGTCRQTMRALRKRPIWVHDTLTLFEWSGKPYRSKWAWRQVETCISSPGVIIFPSGIYFGAIPVPPEYIPLPVPWCKLDELAALDGIVPAKGLELERIMIKNHGIIPKDGWKFQIIRW